MIVVHWLRFLLLYGWDVVRSSVQVARDVLSIHPNIDPAFVRVPLRKCNDIQLVLLSNLITFTPGTVFVDVTESGDECVIHTLYGGETPENIARLGAEIAKLQDELEKLIL